MSTALANTLVSVLLPPFCLILIGALGIAVSRRRPRLGRNLVVTSFALLWIVSTTAANIPFLHALAWPQPVDLNAAQGAQAIVVLGGGVARKAPEYDGTDTVNARTLERIRYAARLSRQTGLPMLVSGGSTREGVAAEAGLMKSVLESEFAAPVRWTEAVSRNTYENARESARILRAAGIGRVLLVTDALHMQRAVQAFAPTGIEVVPAPVNLIDRDPLAFRHFLPSPVGFQTSYFIAHELLGRAWYAIKARLE